MKADKHNFPFHKRDENFEAMFPNKEDSTARKSLRKGVADIEFTLSVIVFLSIITFVTFVIISNIPLLRSESYNNDLRARAYEISQLLMFDTGEPANWTNATVKRLGLSSGERYSVSMDKANNLSALCSAPGGYQAVKSLLGQNLTDVRINITAPGANVQCGPQITRTSRTEFSITRIGMINATNATMTMAVSIF